MSNKYQIKHEITKNGVEMTVDEALSDTSSNPVANWLLKKLFDEGGGGGGGVGPQGPPGPPGQDGEDGEDGFSPIAKVTRQTGKVVIEITDKNGTTSADVYDGLQGNQGPQGVPGPAGQDGRDGQDGQDGSDGQDGQDGRDGQDGVGITNIAKTSTSGLVDTYTITLSDGTTKTFTVTNGADGEDAYIPNLATLKTELLKTVYPVGSIYMSVNNTSPASFMGGTWVQIEDTFLLAAGSTYTAGDTGGAATVKLTSANLPKHTHTYSKSATATASHTLTTSEIPAHTHGSKSLVGTWANWGEGSSSVSSTANGYKVTGIVSAVGDNNQYGWGTTTGRDQDNTSLKIDATHEHTSVGGGGGHTHNITLTSTDSGDGGFSNTAHNNMPPYLTVYVWKRTA